MLEQLRSVRIGQVAVFDVVVSVLGMMLIAYWLGKPMWQGALIAIPLGFIVHWFLGVDTALGFPSKIKSRL